MTLYMLVIDWADGEWQLCGIYSTRKKAEKAKKHLTTPSNRDYIRVDTVVVDEDLT